MHEHSLSIAPPARADVVRSSSSEKPTLLVVVDTEEEFDWYAPFDRRNTGVEHMRSIGSFQALCDEARIVPTYVVTYPIATKPASVDVLRAIRADGRCEIGAHLHPWVNPPFDEEVNARNSYPGNLPRDLERAKLEQLASAIEASFGARPTVYKAGRYGFGPNTAEILEELGFEVDLSPCPPFDFGTDGGPDWSAFPCEPFWVGPKRAVLSIPSTGAYIGFVKDGAHGLYELATAASLRWARLPGILARVGAVERLFLSPEGHAFEDLRRLTNALLDRGVRSFTFSVHSPSFAPGHTPYVRSDGDRASLLETCRRTFELFLGELGGTSQTAIERRHAIESNAEPPR